MLSQLAFTKNRVTGGRHYGDGRLHETNEVHNEMQPDDLLSVNESESAVKDQDPPVYPSCPLRLSESVLLIMTLAIRHKLTGDALADVIKLIDLHCIPGPNSHSIKTLRELKSFFADSKEALNQLFYCNYCFCLLPTEHTSVCPICATDLDAISTAKRYFVVLPIKQQLSRFLSREYKICIIFTYSKIVLNNPKSYNNFSVSLCCSCKQTEAGPYSILCPPPHVCR